MSDKEHENYLVISYFPKYYPLNRPGVAFELQTDNMIMPKAGGAAIKACLWMVVDDQYCPVFVLDDAQGVYDHLLCWSEKRPVDWFKLQAMSYGGRYGLAMIPRVEKSIERFKTARFINFGEIISSKSKFNVVFDPLCFISGGSGVFDNICGDFGDHMKVYFLDCCDLPKNPVDIDFGKAILVGEFELEKSSQYIKDLIDES